MMKTQDKCDAMQVQLVNIYRIFEGFLLSASKGSNSPRRVAAPKNVTYERMTRIANNLAWRFALGGGLALAWGTSLDLKLD